MEFSPHTCGNDNIPRLELAMTAINYVLTVADKIQNILDPGYVFRAEQNPILGRSGYLQAKRLRNRTRKRAPLQI